MSTSEHTIPQGRAAGWSEVMRGTPALAVVLVTVGAHMALFGMLTPVMATYAQGFGIPGWQVGLMITVFAAGRLAADLPAGHIADRFGLPLLLCGGPLLCAVGSEIGALATDYGVLLGGRTVQGVGSGLYMTATSVFVARISDARNRGKVMALYQGAMLTGAAMGPVAGGLAADWLGASGPFHVSAVVGASTAVLAFAMLRDGPKGGSLTARTHRGHGGLILTLPFLSLLAVNFAVFLTRTAGQWQMIPLMATERFGSGPEDIGVAITLSALATLGVLPLAARLVERVPRVPLITLSLLATGLCLVAIVLSESMAGTTAAMVAMGVTTGIGGPAVAAYAIELAPADRYGPAMGTMRFAGDLGYLVGPLSIALLIDATDIGQSGGLIVNAVLLALLTLGFALANAVFSTRPTS